MKRFLYALALAIAASAPSVAQPAPPAVPPVEDVEAQVLEDLVVTARLPGPAWWRVSDGDTTVYVLGVPDALPRGLPWDQTILKRRLKGAHSFITPPVYRARGNPLALPLIYARYRDASRTREDLESTLTPALRERFRAAMARAGGKPRDYEDLRPLFAGIRLSGDYRKRAGLVYGEPLKTITALGRKARLKPTPAMTEDTTIDALLATLKALPPEAGRTCLEAAVDEVEAGDRVVRTVAFAWAGGDVPTVLTARRSAERCWATLPGAARLKRESLAGQAAAIERALGKPGHAVAVLSLRSLVAREGILQRLRTKGFKVDTPGA